MGDQEFALADAARYGALEMVEILDSVCEDDFDEVASLAALICETPIALITFAGSGRMWFKARIGVEATECPACESVCIDVVASDEIVVIEDLSSTEKYGQLPAVLGDPNYRFYAGTPVHAPNGVPIGTICVVDYKKRTIGDKQIAALRALGNQADRLLRLRCALKLQKEIEVRLEIKKVAIDGISEGVVLQGSQGEVVDYNPAALKILGLTPEALLKRNPTDPSWIAIREDGSQMCGDDHPAIIALRTGKQHLNTVMGLPRNGSDHRWFNVSSVPIFHGTAGRPSQVVTSFADITEIKKLEANHNLLAATLTAAARLSQLGEMAAGIAHEINNPLAIIQGKAGLIMQRLEAGKLNCEDMARDLTIIEKTVSRIAKIISGLLTYSRDGSNDRFHPANLKEIIEGTLQFCREKFRQHSIRLEITCESDLLLTCRSGEISQILLNLLNNSFDAVIDEENKWVRVTANEKNGEAILRVTDSGLRIPEDVVKRLMQPFFTTKPVGRGTGIGLSIARNLAHGHCGKLEYDSSALHTTFVLSVPVKQSSRTATVA